MGTSKSGFFNAGDLPREALTGSTPRAPPDLLPDLILT